MAKATNGGKTATKPTTASVAGKTVATLQKLEVQLKSLSSVIDELNSLPETVEVMKNDLSLGFDVFVATEEERKATFLEAIETEINAKREAKEAILKALEVEEAEKREDIAELKVEFEKEQAAHNLSLTRSKEALTYEYQKDVRDLRQKTAEDISKQLGLKLVNAEEFSKLEQAAQANVEAIEKAAKDAEVKAKIGYNAEVANIKASNALEVKELQIKLAASEDKVSRLEAEVLYLKGEITATRLTIEKSVAAAKADVTVTQQSGK